MEEKYPSLPSALHVNPYTVPDGYFADLKQRTLAQCRLSEMAEGMGEVPTGYFDQLSDRIVTKLKEQQLKETITEAGFTVPDGYFEQLEAQVRIQQHGIEKGTKSGFTVPETYFDTLQQTIASQTYQQPSTTPIRKMGRSKWMGYAAAACVALAVGIVGVNQLTAEDPTPTSNHLASVSDQEIFNYLELYGTDNDVAYISEQLNEVDEPVIGEGISAEDIEAYLNHTL